MKRLQDIRSFPGPQRDVLERQFGISTAEAFFEHATRHAEGVRAALGLTEKQLTALKDSVDDYLTSDFVKSCRRPLKKHPRGVIVE